MVTEPLPSPVRATTVPATVIITADAMVREPCERLAAAAGAPVETVADIGAGFRRWRTAGAVLVGADLAAELATLAPERRDRVCVIAASAPGEAVLRASIRLGATSVIELPGGEQQVATVVAEAGDTAGHRGRMVGVVGGSGGIGATTVACALGQVVERPAVVVEVEPLGPGVDRVLGIEEEAGLHWSDLAGSRGRLNGRAVRDALPSRDGVGALAFGGRTQAPEASVVRDVVAALRRGHESVIVDLPRPGSTLWQELAPRCDLVVVVVEASVTGVAAGGRVIAHLPDPARVRVVLRPGVLDPEVVAAALGVAVVGEVPRSRRVPESIDLGYGPIRSRRDRLARSVRSWWREVDG